VHWVSRALAILVWCVIAVGSVVGYFALGLPSVDQAVLTRRPNILVTDSAGDEILSIGDNYGRLVDLASLPAHVSRAVIAVEDRRFYAHPGIDVVGLVRSAAVNVAAGRVMQGGSTITQQVAKNLFLTPERTVARKVREILLAVWLERVFTKDQILTLYLNRVYLGAGTFGIEAAAERYFDRPAAQLTLFQSAVLAGLLKAPSRLNPITSPELARSRARIVLGTMVEAGFIDAAAAAAADRSAPGVLKAAAAARPQARARYFGDWVVSQIESFIGPVDRDVIVRTTLDPAIQRAAETALARRLATDGEAKNIGQGAIVVMRPDGAVVAMVGGRDYADSQFNRATQALRQPGSAFKPFVFLAGLKSGLTAADIFDDAPIEIDGWRPQNFSGTFRGPVSLAEAVAQSINTVAVNVARRAGLRSVIAEARRLGITGPIPRDYSAALGSGEVTLLELTAAYAPFANGGQGALPFGISEITARSGEVLFRRSGTGLGRVVSQAHVGAMNGMLRDVLISGTGKDAAFGFPAAGKTGTSSDFRDAWFVGYSADMVAGVWLGNDNGAGMKAVTGGGIPALIWRDVMSAAHRDRPMRDLPGDGERGIGGLIQSLFGD
jgi:penicillin-binding protein 1A